ncbi:phospholipase D family protein [bacterium]|nr:phospholipase D family protein [bacterium]
MKSFLPKNFIVLLTCWIIMLGADAWPAPVSADRLIFDPGLRKIIRQEIANSQVSVAVEVYKLTDRQVIADLAKAAADGVKVQVILCSSQVTNQKAAAQLRNSGALVRWYPLSQTNQIMHLKMGIFDCQRLIFGSPNWTYWGLTKHHEGILIAESPGLLQQAGEQFACDWECSLDKPQLPKRQRK